MGKPRSTKRARIGCPASAGIMLIAYLFLDWQSEGLCNRTRGGEMDEDRQDYRSEAARRGNRSSAAIPLVCDNKAIGAMRFYSAEMNFFNDREIRLLEELVTDICFALELIDNDGKLCPEDRW